MPCLGSMGVDEGPGLVLSLEELPWRERQVDPQPNEPHGVNFDERHTEGSSAGLWKRGRKAIHAEG